MAPEEPKRRKRRRKLGRGLADISHVFLSGAEKNTPQDEPKSSPGSCLADAEVLSVTSGEGLRGKTVLSAGLAFGLSLEGYKIAVVNTDASRPNILDVTGAARADSGSSEFMSNPEYGSIPEADLSAGYDAGSPGAPSAGVAIDSIEGLARQVQRIIVDTSPVTRTGPAVWGLASLILVITEPNSEGMKSSYMTIKRIHAVSPGARIGLVVNQARDRSEAGRCHRKLSNACRRFLKTNLRNYGYIVPSEAVKEACRRSVPLAREYPGARVTRCIENIVRLIIMDQRAIARRRREVTV